MSQALFEQGVTAAKSGHNTEARQIFQRILENDPTIGAGWLWLMTLTQNPDEKRYCLIQTLTINPDNKLAIQSLKDLGPGEMTSPFLHKPLMQKAMTSKRVETKDVASSPEKNVNTSRPSGCLSFFAGTLKYSGLTIILISLLAMTDGVSMGIFGSLIGTTMWVLGEALSRKH